MSTPQFKQAHLDSIAKVLGNTNHGFSGSEIERILAGLEIPDIDPSNTKWRRLYNALADIHNKYPSGNHVVRFIEEAMNIARYTQKTESFALRRDLLNPILAPCGMTVDEGGKVQSVKRATTLDEALEQRANRFKKQLEQREVHHDVLQFCNAEILSDNYFYAVFEAMKSLTAKIREIGSSNHLNNLDGQNLVNKAFGYGKNNAQSPLLAINSLTNETLRGEQRGFTSLLNGLYGTIRNPLAHEPSKDWEMKEQDALDIMSMISLIHRKLDKAKRCPYWEHSASKDSV